MKSKSYILVLVLVFMGVLSMIALSLLKEVSIPLNYNSRLILQEEMYLYMKSYEAYVTQLLSKNKKPEDILRKESELLKAQGIKRKIMFYDVPSTFLKEGKGNVAYLIYLEKEGSGSFVNAKLLFFNTEVKIGKNTLKQYLVYERNGYDFNKKWEYYEGF